MKIEIHLLQTLPPSSVNRDENNNPKTANFGGVGRTRISSQAIKNAVRMSNFFTQETKLEPSDRTRMLVKLLVDSSANQLTEEVAGEFVSKLLGGYDQKTGRSSTLFYVSGEEVLYIVDMLKSGADIEKLVKDFVRKFADRTSSVDIALFGRMLTENPKLTLPASCQVAHAISTHRSGIDFDYYTAQDTLPDENGRVMAAMIGNTPFTSSTYYKYAAIDYDLLVGNLNENYDLAMKGVRGFLKAFALQMPSGKQNSFAANTLPYFLLGVVRKDGQAWSLVNAFEKPVSTDDGIEHNSLIALLKHWDRLSKAYTISNSQPIVFSMVVDKDMVSDLDLPEKLPGTECSNFEEWVTQICNSIG